MTPQKGRDVLIRIRNENTIQSYETVAGLRKREIKFSAPGVENTHAHSVEGWREFLRGASPKSIEIAGQGVFVDASTNAKLSEAFFEVATPEFELILPGFGTIRGRFLISELTYGGRHDGEMDFSILLKSAGEIQMEALSDE